MERTNDYNQTNRLQELGGSDYEIADHQPNIKGWTVKDAQGQTIGEVDELIFDVQSRKVRYMVVDLEGSTLDLDPRDVLIPIGIADLHESDDDVILPTVTAEQLRSLPTYHKGRIDQEHETSIRSIFAAIGGAAAGAGAALTNHHSDRDDFYNHELFSDRSFTRRRTTGTTNDYAGSPPSPNPLSGDTAIPIIEENLEVGKREVETGGVHVSSRMVERPVEEHVRLREERVVVERTPVDRPATASDLNTFQEGEIELTQHAEVPVVSKEARVVEEVVLEKDVEERDEVIRETVRSTEVDVDNLNTGSTGTEPTLTNSGAENTGTLGSGTTDTNSNTGSAGTSGSGLDSIATGTKGTGIGKTGSGFTDTDRDRGSLTSDPTLI
jgi:stress response protein YsnF